MMELMKLFRNKEDLTTWETSTDRSLAMLILGFTHIVVVEIITACHDMWLLLYVFFSCVFSV